MTQNRYLNSARVVIIMMIFTICTKFLGFIREVFLGQTFGTSYETDAYIIALSIPTMLFSAVLAAITTTYIPIYTRIKNEQGIKRANYFTNNLLSLICLIAILLMILGFFFSEHIVNLLGSGLSVEGTDLANRLTQISIFLLLTLGLISIMTVYLQAQNEFLVPAFINIPIIVIVTIALYFGEHIGIKGVMIANIIGTVVQIVILKIFVRKSGFNMKLIFNIKDKYLKQMMIMVIPIFIGTSVQQISLMIDRMLASNFGDGVISALSFGSKVNEMFFGLVSVTIATFIFPKLADLATKKYMNQFDAVVRTSLNVVSILVTPIVFIVICFSDDIIKILFERGAFNESSTLITSEALFYYSLGMVFFGFRDVLNRTFYSMGDTKTPMVNAIWVVIANIVMSLLLIRLIGYKGIPLATSLAAIITCILLFISLQKKLKEFKYKDFCIDQLKIIFSSIIMAIVCYALYSVFQEMAAYNNLYNFIILLFCVLLGALIYVLLLIFLKLQEITTILNLVCQKIGLNFLNK